MRTRIHHSFDDPLDDALEDPLEDPLDNGLSFSTSQLRASKRTSRLHYLVQGSLSAFEKSRAAALSRAQSAPEWRSLAARRLWARVRQLGEGGDEAVAELANFLASLLRDFFDEPPEPPVAMLKPTKPAVGPSPHLDPPKPEGKPRTDDKPRLARTLGRLPIGLPPSSSSQPQPLLWLYDPAYEPGLINGRPKQVAIPMGLPPSRQSSRDLDGADGAQPPSSAPSSKGRLVRRTNLGDRSPRERPKFSPRERPKFGRLSIESSEGRHSRKHAALCEQRVRAAPSPSMPPDIFPSAAPLAATPPQPGGSAAAEPLSEYSLSEDSNGGHAARGSHVATRASFSVAPAAMPPGPNGMSPPSATNVMAPPAIATMHRSSSSLRASSSSRTSLPPAFAPAPGDGNGASQPSQADAPACDASTPPSDDEYEVLRGSTTARLSSAVSASSLPPTPPPSPPPPPEGSAGAAQPSAPETPSAEIGHLLALGAPGTSAAGAGARRAGNGGQRPVRTPPPLPDNLSSASVIEVAREGAADADGSEDELADANGSAPRRAASPHRADDVEAPPPPTPRKLSSATEAAKSQIKSAWGALHGLVARQDSTGTPSALAASKDGAPAKDAPRFVPGRSGVTSGYLLPIARELTFKYEIEEPPPAHTAEADRFHALVLLAVWEETLEAQQQTEFWTR